MMNFKLRAEFLGRTEAEIVEEMASALGRIGRKLESLIDQLRVLQSKVDTEPANRGDLVNEYNKVYREAHLYYYYLIVQREAIGLRNHDQLPEIYPLPSKSVYKSNRNDAVNSIL